MGTLGFHGIQHPDTMVCCCVCVSTAEVAIIEKCGKFDREGSAGCNIMNPFCCESVAATVSTRVEQMTIHVNVQIKNAKDSYYELLDPTRQIKAYVEDSVRAKVPQMKLDEVFEKKSEVADKIKDDLCHHLEQYGYYIVSALVTEVEPEKQVKDAMNRKNAAVRLRQAAIDEAE